jgi:hypothetical protein
MLKSGKQKKEYLTKLNMQLRLKKKSYIYKAKNKFNKYKTLKKFLNKKSKFLKKS